MCVYRNLNLHAEEILSTESCLNLYNQAIKLGFTDFVLWGGEPTIRDDIERLIGYLYKNKRHVTLITNGSLLHKKQTLLPLLSQLLISLDAPDNLHNEIRQKPGLFQTIDYFTESVKGQLPLIFIAVLGKHNADRIPALIEYAEKKKAWILFQGLNNSDYGFGEHQLDKTKFELSPEDQQRLFSFIRQEKEAGKPILNSKTYLKMFELGKIDYTCYYKHTLVRVEPNGKILDCTEDQREIGDLRTQTLASLLKSTEYKHFLHRSHSCTRCSDVGVIETSCMWKGNRECLVNLIKNI